MYFYAFVFGPLIHGDGSSDVFVELRCCHPAVFGGPTAKLKRCVIELCGNVGIVGSFSNFQCNHIPAIDVT